MILSKLRRQKSRRYCNSASKSTHLENRARDRDAEWVNMQEHVASQGKRAEEAKIRTALLQKELEKTKEEAKSNTEKLERELGESKKKGAILKQRDHLDHSDGAGAC